MITNSATDPDLPAQTLTFSLLASPSNAAINSSSGIFVWRPTVSQANSTNIVRTIVTDNGFPSLSDTNTFTITVNPLNQPILTSVGIADGEINLLANGDAGPDYTLLASTNLTDWQPVLTTKPSVLPVSLVVTNSGAPQQYYRIQLGP
jgi:hypothetical protein